MISPRTAKGTATTLTSLLGMLFVWLQNSLKYSRLVVAQTTLTIWSPGAWCGPIYRLGGARCDNFSPYLHPQCHRYCYHCYLYCRRLSLSSSFYIVIIIEGARGVCAKLPHASLVMASHTLLGWTNVDISLLMISPNNVFLAALAALCPPLSLHNLCQH